MPPREPTKTSSGRTFQRKGLDSSPTRLAFSFYSIPYYSIQETEEALLFVHEQSVSHPALTCSLNSASSVPCGDMRQLVDESLDVAELRLRLGTGSLDLLIGVQGLLHHGRKVRRVEPERCHNKHQSIQYELEYPAPKGVASHLVEHLVVLLGKAIHLLLHLFVHIASLSCVYCTKLEPIFKTNDSEKAPRTGEYASNPKEKCLLLS